MKRWLPGSLLLILALVCSSIRADDVDVLPPEQAFRSTARLADPDTLEVRYTIADGYYLYRDKFNFSSETRGIGVGTPVLPPGKLKTDEFFGTVETYRGEVSIRVPVTSADTADAIRLKSQFQGCADAGICYTPQTRVSTIQLAMAQSATLSDAGSSLARLKQSGVAATSIAPPALDADEGEEEFLPVDKAFRIEVRVRDANSIEAAFLPEPSYYLYRDKIGLSIAQGKGVSVDTLTVPRGERKSDPNFGDTEVFHHPFKAVATLKRTSMAAQNIAVDVRLQGCSEKGLCYPPTTQRVHLMLAASSAAAGPSRDVAASDASDFADAAQIAASTEERGAGSTASQTASTAGSPSASTLGTNSAFGSASAPAPAFQPGSTVATASVRSGLSSATQPDASTDPADEAGGVTRLLRNAGFWGVVGSFLGFGLLLAFTPCMFPMIPILSGIIVGQGKTLTRSKGLTLSAIYVLGMAITYALAGVAAGLSGAMLTSMLQNPWVLGTFALIFVALALSMFGFYDLQMPSALQSRLTDASNRQKGGTAGGVFTMGVLSALIVGPCVAAPLAGALVYISQTRDVVLGGTALFAMGLGMGAPLLIVGWSAGSLLPRAGAWMQTVKNFFGVLLLAVALWLISPVIPAVAQMLGWAALLICSAVYLHAVDPLPPHASGLRKLWKGVGVIALLMGVALLIGALSGGRDPLQPLAGLRAESGTKAAAHGPAFERVASIAQLEQRIAAAKGKPVMLDFYADWCVSCKEMERFTFGDAAVKASMERFVLLQADVTGNSAQDEALLKRFGLFGPPGIIFFDTRGQEQRTRVVGFQPPEKFAQVLQGALR